MTHEREVAAQTPPRRRRYRDLRRQRKARQRQVVELSTRPARRQESLRESHAELDAEVGGNDDDARDRSGGMMEANVGSAAAAGATSPESKTALESKVHLPGRYDEIERSGASSKTTGGHGGESKAGGKEVVDLWEYGQTQVGFVVKAPPPSPHCKLQYTGAFGVGYTCLVCGVHREYKKTTHCTGRDASDDGDDAKPPHPVNGVFPYNAEKMIRTTLTTHAMCAQPAPLLRMATEMQQEIMLFLDFRTICRLDRTCMGWYAATHGPSFGEILVTRDVALHERLGFDAGMLSACWNAWGIHNRMDLRNSAGKGGNAPARLATSRYKCFTMMLHRESPRRFSRYAAQDVRTNQVFRNRLHACSLEWVEFLILELTDLCHVDAHRSSHCAFLTKLRFVDKELSRRRHGRKATARQGLLMRLEDMRRRVGVAVRIGRKPRQGEAKIRELKCNWRK